MPPLSPHNAKMEEVHLFTVRIEADPLNKRRFRWTICEGNPIVIRSPYSYATRREANKEANEMLLRYVATWRSIR
jgi:hypothetical protein